MNSVLKELCLAFSPAGEENEVRDIIIKNLDREKNEYHEDKLGNLIVLHKGEKQTENLGFFTFMHEAGLMVHHITDDGFVNFISIEAQKENLSGKSFYCKTRELYAVSSTKTWHTSSKEQREAQPDDRKLVLDFGAGSKEDAEKYIRPSDQFVFESSFRENPDGSFSCKAMERSAASLALLNALNSDISKEFYGIFLSGGKGAKGPLRVSAANNNISYGIILDAMGAGDNPFCPESEKNCKMKKGFSIAFTDGRIMYNKALVNLIIDTAKDKGIAYQLRNRSYELSFLSSLLDSGKGVRTALIGLPVEYPSSPSCTVFYEDIKAVEDIIKSVSEKAISL